jgi:hypothetical protein
MMTLDESPACPVAAVFATTRTPSLVDEANGVITKMDLCYRAAILSVDPPNLQGLLSIIET